MMKMVVLIPETIAMYCDTAAPGTTARYQKLAAQFEQVFGQAPALFARAPGECADAAVGGMHWDRAPLMMILIISPCDV